MQDNDLVSRAAAKNEFWALMKELTKATVEPLPDNALGALAGYSIIENLPAVDAAPVVHGRWEFCGDDYLVCSVCGARYYKVWLIQSYCTGPGSDQMDGFLYCPHCNALLDGGENQ